MDDWSKKNTSKKVNNLQSGYLPAKNLKFAPKIEF